MAPTVAYNAETVTSKSAQGPPLVTSAHQASKARRIRRSVWFVRLAERATIGEARNACSVSLVPSRRLGRQIVRYVHRARLVRHRAWRNACHAPKAQKHLPMAPRCAQPVQLELSLTCHALPHVHLVRPGSFRTWSDSLLANPVSPGSILARRAGLHALRARMAPRRPSKEPLRAPHARQVSSMMPLDRPIAGSVLKGSIQRMLASASVGAASQGGTIQPRAFPSAFSVTREPTARQMAQRGVWSVKLDVTLDPRPARPASSVQRCSSTSLDHQTIGQPCNLRTMMSRFRPCDG
mmetsp:Transcript_38534/g.88993  ORF Transcript_38534/g.88993 Transcript_38534/m.88993 type:complete len:294 (-) Transcript_38534:2860-3741(-)